MQTQSEVIKATKTPVIYLAVSGKNDITAKLQEGLKHLNVQIADGDDMQNANMVVILDDNIDLVKKAWQNGVIPITSNFHDSIEDYNPNAESGNAFVFENNNEWEVFAAIVRACETYKFPYDWKFIVRSCQKAD